MKRILPILSLMASIAFFSPLALHAQDVYEDDQKLQEKHEKERIVRYDKAQYNHEGDQFLKVGLDFSIPMRPLNPFDDGHMKIGGLGMLGYHVFITPIFSAGADVIFGFNTTIGDNIFNYIPIVITASYHPTLGKFEFPVTLGIGCAWETYNNNTYWPGLLIRPEAGIHYRIADSWSLGLDASYNFMPQFCKFWGTGEKNIWMQFFNAGITARYFF